MVSGLSRSCDLSLQSLDGGRATLALRGVFALFQDDLLPIQAFFEGAKACHLRLLVDALVLRDGCTVTDFVAVSTNNLVARGVFRVKRRRPRGRGMGEAVSPWRGCFWVVLNFMKQLLEKILYVYTVCV